MDEQWLKLSRYPSGSPLWVNMANITTMDRINGPPESYTRLWDAQGDGCSSIKVIEHPEEIIRDIVIARKYSTVDA